MNIIYVHTQEELLTWLEEHPQEDINSAFNMLMNYWTYRMMGFSEQGLPPPTHLYQEAIADDSYLSGTWPSWPPPDGSNDEPCDHYLSVTTEGRCVACDALVLESLVP